MTSSIAPTPKRSRRRLIGVVASLVLAAQVAVAVPAHPAEAATVLYGGAPGASRISVIGDSVMAAIRWYGTWTPLRRFNYTFDAESCRRTTAVSCRGREGYTPDNTLSAMRRLRGQLGSVLVVGTGYDDPGVTFAGSVDAVMAEAAVQGIPVVVWATMRTADVTYVGPTYASNASTFRDNNRILLAKAVQYGGRLQVADWATYSANHPEWVERDGIHLTPSGANAMALFIANQAAIPLQGITGLTASVAPTGGVGAGQVLLTWSHPNTTSGRVVTDYRVQQSADGGASWQTVADGVSRTRAAVVSGLTNGRAYQFRVAAYTSRGWGPDSAIVSATPKPAKASAPSGLSAAVAPSAGMGGGQVLLTWNLPGYTGNRVVTDYAVQRSIDGGATWETLVDGVSSRRWFVMSGLVNRQVYRFRVAAYTASGWGPYSATVGAIPRAAKASAPGGLSAAVAPSGGVGAGEVLLTWNPPGYTGNRVVTDYAIQSSVDNGATWQTVADGVSSRSSYVMSGLINGRGYRFRVAAYTASGWGPYSAIVSATPKPAKVSAPEGLSAAVAPSGGVGSGEVLLSWVLPTYTGNRTVTDYAIQQSGDGGTTWITLSDGVSKARSSLVSDLSDGTAYQFRVAAYTASGWGPYGVAVDATPGGVTLLAATALVEDPSATTTMIPDVTPTSDAPSEPTLDPSTTTTVTTGVPGTSVGDFVWIDVDENGVQGGDEPGVAGVVVRLIGSDGSVMDEDVTDESGLYELATTSTGAFALEVVIPEGFEPTLIDAGADDTLDSDANLFDVVVGPIETTVRVVLDHVGETGVDLDVGLVPVLSEPVTTTTTTAAPPTTTPTTTTTTTTTSTATAITSTEAAPTTSPVTSAPESTTTLTVTSESSSTAATVVPSTT